MACSVRGIADHADAAERHRVPHRARRVAREVAFTTHTPVPAGHDRFDAGLMEEHLGPLRESLGLSQPTVSHHLKKLTEAGLLEREQRGKWAYFSLRREAVEVLAAVADLKGACC